MDISQKEFEEYYILGDFLGSGSFGNVHVAKGKFLDANYKKLQNANGLTILASALQDERFNLVFNILLDEDIPSVNLR